MVRALHRSLIRSWKVSGRYYGMNPLRFASLNAFSFCCFAKGGVGLLGFGGSGSCLMDWMDHVACDSVVFCWGP